jgi:glycolate oxidase
MRSDEEGFRWYGSDETEDFNFPPELVLKPTDVAQVSAIAKFCNDHRIPLTTRGAGTGLSGGALPIHGGIVLSTERLNKILEIDVENLQATVEPGVINQQLRDAVEAIGLFYPPDPSSRGSSFIGGNVAENAGGPRAVKYGTTKDYILNCEVVLPDGSVFWTGANVLKNATGYNLTQLIVGSEGTLGIVTKIVVRLIPLPKFNLTLLIPFQSPENACKAVSAIFQAGITPSALEFMERNALKWASSYLNIPFEILDDIKAHLLIEVDGNHEDLLFRECEQITEVVERFGCGEILFADSHDQKESLWKMRRSVGHAVKSNSVYKEEDTVVPRAKLPELLNGIKVIGQQYGFESVCYGHAGDGNLHVNIIRGELTDDQWNNDLPKGITEIFQLVKKLGGTISGEHGIGYVQKNFLPIVFSSIELRIMKQIKDIFDPFGILNPGKIFPDA